MNDIILAFALVGAYHAGKLQGTADSTPGNKFRGAYGAADDAGLTTSAEYRALRIMFVHGYLDDLPTKGVRTDSDNIVTGEPDAV